MKRLVALVALVGAGCASFASPPDALVRADRLAVAGDFDGALRAYTAALDGTPDAQTVSRATAGRAAVTAALAARDEARRLREELATRETAVARLRDEIAARERDVARLTRDLTAREGELARARQDVSARQVELQRLGLETEELRMNLEALKRIEMRLERRR